MVHRRFLKKVPHVEMTNAPLLSYQYSTSEDKLTSKDYCFRQSYVGAINKEIRDYQVLINKHE